MMVRFSKVQAMVGVVGVFDAYVTVAEDVLATSAVEDV